MNITKAIKIKTQQGERLKEFRLKKGFKKKSSFAREIGSSHSTVSAIENYGREVSDSFLDLLKNTFKDLNEQWLLTGTPPMLLSEYKLGVSIEDKNNSYQQLCSGCIKKDNEIVQLKEELSEARKELIECLKEVSALRKAPSG